MDPQVIFSKLSQLDDNTLSSIIAQILQNKPELAPGLVTVACPDLTYAPSKALTERRCSGVIKRYNQQLGYGFIACPELSAVFGCDVFVHKKQMGHFMEGQEVNFAVTLNKDNKPQAFDLLESMGSMIGIGGMGAMYGMGGMAGMGPMGGMGGMGGMNGTGNLGAMGAMGAGGMGALGSASSSLGSVGGMSNACTTAGAVGSMGAMGGMSNLDNMRGMYDQGGMAVGANGGSMAGVGPISGASPGMGAGDLMSGASMACSGFCGGGGAALGSAMGSSAGSMSGIASMGGMGGMDAMGGMGGNMGMGMDDMGMGGMMSMQQQMAGGKKGGGKGGMQVVLGEFLGVIKSFNVEKGFGFIVCDALKEQSNGDVYLHQKHVGDFQVGAEVKFQAYLHNGRLQGRELQDATGMVGPQTGSGKDGVGRGTELGCFTGRIKNFNVEKGYGFIQCDDLSMQGYHGDVFLHARNVETFSVGDEVAFTVYMYNGKLQARELQDPAALGVPAAKKSRTI